MGAERYASGGARLRKTGAVLAVLCVLGIILGVALQALVERGVRTALDEFRSRKESGNLVIDEAGIGGLRLSPGKGLLVTDFHSGGKIKGDSTGNGQAFTAAAERIELRLDDLFSRDVAVVFRGVTIQAEESAAGAGEDLPDWKGTFTSPSVRILLRYSPLNSHGLKMLVRRVKQQSLQLFTTGEWEIPLYFNGRISFSVNEKPFDAAIYSETAENGFRVVISEEDIERIAMSFDLKNPLTAAERSILSRHPLKAPRLFELHTRARRESLAARRKDRAFPEDAYRHVLWSYLLAREFGGDFARMVTDAHEQGRTGNSAAEKAMDMQNNAVGRRYARAGIPPAMVRDTFLTDPAVRRTADSSP